MKTLEQIANDEELLNIGREAIQDALLDRRDSRIAVLGRGNGLVIREKDGKESSIMRMGPEEALRIGLLAIHKHLNGE